MPSSRTNRTPIQSVRLTPGELAVVRGKVRAAGMPVSTFLRQVGLGKKVRVRPGQVVSLELLEAALQELRRVLDKLDR